MSSDKIKVILIEDSGLMRIIISEILRRDEELLLIATANNGKEGVEKVMELEPDVVVTDVMMPHYDAAYVVKSLAGNSKIPIILLSSLERNDEQIFELLRDGAFDFVDKPGKKEDLKDYELIPLIKAASKEGRPRAGFLRTQNVHHHTFSKDLDYDILLIGASTGGPGAIEFILDHLPVNLAIPVVIAQHMPERFLESFADRLNAKGIFKIKLAEEGEVPKPGRVYIAGGQRNLRIKRERKSKHARFIYTSDEFTEFNNPSIDCLFSSAAEVYGRRTIALILTGMGKDGMTGLVKIKYAGGFTLAQDETTSVVYGMPKAAVDAGAVKQVLKLQEMPGFIVSCLS